MGLLDTIKKNQEETADLEMGAKVTYIGQGTHTLEVSDYELVDKKKPKTGKLNQGPAFSFKVLESDNPTHVTNSTVNRTLNLNVQGYLYKYRVAELESLVGCLFGTETKIEDFAEDLETQDKFREAVVGKKVVCRASASGKTDASGNPYVNLEWFAA